MGYYLSLLRSYLPPLSKADLRQVERRRFLLSLNRTEYLLVLAANVPWKNMEQ